MLKVLSVAAVACGLLAGCNSATTQSGSASAPGWSCEASGLASGSYSGGDTAYIHLSSYSNGNDYPVKKVSPKKVVGKTGDGTPFSCTLS